MNDIARQLRAQIPSSTDPDRLERMAREIERGISPSRRPGQAQRGQGTPRDLPRRQPIAAAATVPDGGCQDARRRARQELRVGTTEMSTDGRRSAQTFSTSWMLLVRNLSNGVSSFTAFPSMAVKACCFRM